MPVSRTFCALHDNMYGAGQQLAFPTMSTCAACICVLDNQLVGIHKTQGWGSRQVRLFQLAVAAIGAAVVRRLYIAGWNVGDPDRHDVAQIRAALGCLGVPTFTFNYANTIQTHLQWDGRGLQFIHNRVFQPAWYVSKAINLCTFAFHEGTQVPTIGVKRTTKVAVDNSARQAQRDLLVSMYGMADSLYMGVAETITTPSDHLHWLTTFTRV
jgi:hypothetical protein